MITLSTLVSAFGRHYALITGREEKHCQQQDDKRFHRFIFLLSVDLAMDSSLRSTIPSFIEVHVFEALFDLQLLAFVGMPQVD
jgi:hypothetical protein